MQKESARLHVAKNTCNRNRMQKRKGAMTFHCQKCHATAAKCKKKKLNDSCCQKHMQSKQKVKRKSLVISHCQERKATGAKRKKRI
jgi:hypothetical protein